MGTARDFAWLGIGKTGRCLTLIAMIDPEHDPVSVRAAVALVIPSQPAVEDGAEGRDGRRVRTAGAGVAQ